MNPNTIRKIDLWLGKPICFSLTLLRISSAEKSKPKKIIFLKFIEQGATVLAFKALKRAVEMVGRENVYFCVFENNRPILDILDVIPPGNVITIREKTFLSFLGSAFSALVKIRLKNIDTVIDMEFFSRASAIFSFLTGAAIRVGLHRFTSELPYRGDLMTHRIQYNPYLHISIFYHSLVEAVLHNPAEVPMMKIPAASLGITRNTAAFVPKEHERKEMQERLTLASAKRSGEARPGPSPEAGEGSRTAPQKIVLLNPNASDLLPLRKWESEKFVALGKKIISENENVLVIITGAPSEQKDAEDICRQIDSEKAISMAGKTSLKELLTLYTVADVLVTNDSGPGHFSSLTNIQTIILFGPETPKLFGPISPNAQVIWKELTCSPCVNVFNHRFSPCNNNVCMKTITMQEVYDAVKPHLA